MGSRTIRLLEISVGSRTIRLLEISVGSRTIRLLEIGVGSRCLALKNTNSIIIVLPTSSTRFSSR